jgi:secreted trypsin-like serine protease
MALTPALSASATPTTPRLATHTVMRERQPLAHASTRAHASIIGGQQAEAGTFPWLAYIEDRRGRTVGQCSGTVVAPNLVLTAGHCAEDVRTEVERDPSGYVVRTGNVDWTSPETRVSGVSEVIVYPGYHDRRSADGDAALLVLSTPTTAPVIPLDTVPSAGLRARIAGWGVTSPGQRESPNTLRWAETTVQSSEWCERYLSDFDAQAQLCAYDSRTYSTAICGGDSGGPLIWESTPGAPVEIGVEDEGVVSCSPSYATVFVAANLIEWWVLEASTALGPLTQPQPQPAAVTDSPGVYTTVASLTHKVVARVTGDGGHLVNLTAEASLRCQHGYSTTYGVSFYSGESAAINDHVARASGPIAGSRYLRRGHFGIYIHFDSAGIIEGRLSLRVRARNRRVGLCYAPSVKFLAYRAHG